MDNAKTITKATILANLGNFKSVNNTPSRNGCGAAPNQFELYFEHGCAFQSYDTLIGIYYRGEYYFTDSHDYSKTTSGYTTRWCGYSAPERRKGLADGKFIQIVD